MVPFKWQAREWSSKYKWQSTIDLDALEDKVQVAIAIMYSQALSKFISCQFGMMVEIMTKLSCAHAGKKNCFSASIESELGKGTAFAGKKSKLQTNGCSLATNTSDVGEAKGHQQIMAIGSSSHQFIDANADQGRRRLDSRGRLLAAETNCEQYSVIYNKNGAIIGQLVGDGIKVNNKGKLCVPMDQTIPQCKNKFDVFDFAGA